MAIWQKLPVAEIAVGGFRGLYENAVPTARSLGALSSVSNLVLDPAPSLKTRPGITALGTALSANPTRGVFQYRNLAGTTVQTLAQAGQQLSYWSGSAWTSITATAPDKAFMAANLNDLGCLFYAGSAPQKWNGTTLAALGGSPPQGEFVVEAYEQLFLAGIPGREGDLDFCDVADPETWSPAPTNDAGSIPVSTYPIKWVGFDKTQGQVIIWTQRSLEVLQGPETSNRPGLWSIRTVAPHGCPNGRTVQNVGGAWIWLTDSPEPGFAMWAGGAVQVITEPIKTSLGLINWSGISTSCAWTDEQGRYHCQTPKSAGYQEFIYDPKLQAWYVGVSKDIRAAGIITVSGKDYALIGNEVGQMYQATGTDDAGSAIAWSVEIGPSTLGDSFDKKQLLEVRVALSLATGATASAYLSLNEAAYGTAKMVTAGTTLTPVTLSLPVAVTETLLGSTFKLKLTGTGVVQLHDVKLRVYKSAS